MIEVYLNFSGNARQAAQYYAQVFETDPPYLMGTGDMPKAEQDQAGPGASDMLIYGNVKTFAGDIMLSDRMPGAPDQRPNDAMWITLTHTDQALLRRSFDRLAQDGQVLMPLEPSFFSPLYGQVRDKYGYHWMLMVPSHL